MKTKLYQYEGDSIVFTLDEIIREYNKKIGDTLPIFDDEREKIILSKLNKNGRRLVPVNNDVLTWCNVYAEKKKATKYLSQKSRDLDVRDVYMDVTLKLPSTSKLKVELLKDGENTLHDKLLALLKTE